MDYKEANEKLRGKYILVGDSKNILHSCGIKRIAIDFRDDGVVCVKDYSENNFNLNLVYDAESWKYWKPIEDEAPSEQEIESYNGKPEPKKYMDYDTWLNNKKEKICIVSGCTNKKEDGLFTGDICSPCHQMICSGDASLKSNNFIHKLFNEKPVYIPITFTQTPEKLSVDPILTEQEDELRKKVHRNTLQILKETEPGNFKELEADILRRAKEICFTTKYVKHKTWPKGESTSVHGFSDGTFEITDVNYTPLEIIEEWESVDPMKD